MSPKVTAFTTYFFKGVFGGLIKGRLGFIFFFIFLKKVNGQSYYAKLFLIISEFFILDPRDQIRIFLFLFLFLFCLNFLKFITSFFFKKNYLFFNFLIL